MQDRKIKNRIILMETVALVKSLNPYTAGGLFRRFLCHFWISFLSQLKQTEVTLSLI